MTLTNRVLQFTAAVMAALTGITAPALAQDTPDIQFEIVVPRSVHADAPSEHVRRGAALYESSRTQCRGEELEDLA